MRRKGSLTVEAALIVPVSFLAVILFLNLFLFLQVQLRVEKELAEISRELMPLGTVLSKAHAASETADADSEKSAILALFQKLGAEGYLSYRMKEELSGERWLSLIRGGSGGFSFSGSAVYAGDMEIRLLVSYMFVPNDGIFGLGGIPVIQQVTSRGFAGAGRQPVKGGDEQEQEEETKVYITDNASVFHRTTECTYLKISVRPVTQEQLAKERNSSGGKYYACEYCGKKPGDIFYIAEYGERYHKTVSCRALRRNVTAISEEDAVEQGLRPCSKCGGDSG